MHCGFLSSGFVLFCVFISYITRGWFSSLLMPFYWIGQRMTMEESTLIFAFWQNREKKKVKSVRTLFHHEVIIKKGLINGLHFKKKKCLLLFNYSNLSIESLISREISISNLKKENPQSL